ncbi:MAG: hypothetical protein ACRC1H_11625 [Caldilineaceae bacterium]
MSYEIHPLVLAVIPKGQPVYSECVTRIEIEDEAAGPYLEIRQPGKPEADGVVAINDAEEWDAIDQAVRGQLAVIAQLKALEAKE